MDKITKTMNSILNSIEFMTLTSKSVGEAHSRTCLYQTDEIADLMRKPQDARRISYFKGLVCCDFRFFFISNFF